MKKVEFIVNPAAGQDDPVLAGMNAALAPHDLDWDISITHKSGDGTLLARKAIRAGADVIGVYGGDGTLMEVASALAGRDIPLALVPGGTANIMATELGIPFSLPEAVSLVCDGVPRAVDMGEVTSSSGKKHHFILRCGVGYEASVVEGASRELKDRVGVLAYVLSGIKELPSTSLAHYSIVVDGKAFEMDGVSVVLANSAGLAPGLVKGPVALHPAVSVDDGYLDVLVIRSADVTALAAVAAAAIRGEPPPADLIEHRRGRKIRIESDPSQPVICDGESIEPTPLDARVLPRAVRVLVPRPA